MPNPDASLLKVRRSIHINASPERVWQAFTSKSQMDLWWGLTKGSPEAGESKGQWLTAYEPRAGGRVGGTSGTRHSLGADRDDSIVFGIERTRLATRLRLQVLRYRKAGGTAFLDDRQRAVAL